MRRIGTVFSIAAGLILASGTAIAEESDYGGDYESEWESDADYDDDFDMNDDEYDSPRLVTPMGMAFSVGGGVNGFIQDRARDFTSAGGSWEARYVLGTRTHIAGEAAYIGTANDIDALGVASDAVLLSNGVEGAIRLNILTGAWQPYVLGGLGWKHYNVVNTPTNTSDIRESDDALILPVGAGLAYRFNNVFADVRGNFKPSYLSDITRSGTSDDTSLHSWGAQANIGFEF